MAVDHAVIVAYLAGMLGMGWWGMRRAKSKSEFLVAGRRLGPWMYSGTMAAIVLGGASTIGGVGLGYKYGLSGAWMVFTISLGLLALSVLFSARIARLKVYTVSEMLDLRYGGRAGLITGVVPRQPADLLRAARLPRRLCDRESGHLAHGRGGPGELAAAARGRRSRNRPGAGGGGRAGLRPPLKSKTRRIAMKRMKEGRPL